MTISALIDYVENHYGCHAWMVDSQTLRVTCEAVKDGKVFTHEELIPANIHAVRDWLGY